MKRFFVLFLAFPLVFGFVTYAQANASSDSGTRSAYPLLHYASSMTLGELLSRVRKEGKTNGMLAAFNRKYDQNFGSFEDLTKFLKDRLDSGQLKVVSCRSIVGKGSFQTETYQKNGTHEGVWSRTCYHGKNEHVLVDGTEPIMSLYCGNIINPGTTFQLQVHAKQELSIEVSCHTVHRHLYLYNGK